MTPSDEEFPSKSIPIPSPDDRLRGEWMAAYVKRMVERGIDREDAEACCIAGSDDHDYSSDPVYAADDELTYWDDDGDLA